MDMRRAIFSMGELHRPSYCEKCGGVLVYKGLGEYECEECGNRFLSLKIGPKLVCPYCGEEPDMEIGPDEEMPVAKETAKLLEMVEGTENVERMDALLSLAVTGGDYEWI